MSLKCADIQKLDIATQFCITVDLFNTDETHSYSYCCCLYYYYYHYYYYKGDTFSGAIFLIK